MSIKFVMLGFLSEMPATGYDLKKKFSESDMFHWSGNNNQVYRTLVELHDEGLVTSETQQQESKPPRKIYTITEKGQAALRAWAGSAPDLPQFRSPLLSQLFWADQLERQAARGMLAAYESDLEEHIAMLHEQARRSKGDPLRDRIAAHWISFYELERDWVRTLRHEYEKGTP